MEEVAAKGGYEPVKTIGTGAYGTVIAARHMESGNLFAIKRVNNAWSSNLDARRAVLEIKLLRFFRHPNLLCLEDAVMLDDTDIILTTELMETDLSRVIKSAVVRAFSHHMILCLFCTSMSALHACAQTHNRTPRLT